jgi:hypothetical protein
MFYLSGINEIYDFFISNFSHFPLVMGPIFFQTSNQNFHFKFSKWKFSIFFISNFRGAFQFFQFSLVVWLDFFQISIQISKLIFVKSFHFPLVVWPFFFQNSKTKISNSNFKTENFNFKFSLWHKRIFSRPEVAKFIKRLQKLSSYPYEK